MIVMTFYLYIHVYIYGNCTFFPLKMYINPFLTSGDLCRLLITFANSLDSDQDRRSVGPHQNPNRLTLW